MSDDTKTTVVSFDGQDEESSSPFQSSDRNALRQATPHPNKKLRISNGSEDSIQTATGSTTTADDATMEQTKDNAADASLEPVVLLDASSPQDNAAANDQETEQQQDEEEWEAVCQEIQADDSEESSSYQHLQAFQTGVDRHQAALRRLEAVFSQTQTGLEENLTQKLMECVATVHSESFETLQNMEHDIVQTLVSNHECRTRLLEQLEQTNSTWQQHYERAFANILGQPDDARNTVVANHPTNKESSAKETTSVSDTTGNPHSNNNNNNGTIETNMEEDDDGQGLVEPDWSLLKVYEPSRDRIDTFLAGRDQWQQSQDRFGSALDQLYTELKDLQGHVLELVVQAVDTMNAKTDQQQVDIRHLLKDNFQRRQYLETAIAKAADHQQSMFESLFSRVGNSKFGAALGLGHKKNAKSNKKHKASNKGNGAK